jgi:hypothetical protein
MKRRAVRTILACAALVLAGAASEAWAQVDAQKQGAARALFDQARALADKGDFAAACPKFEESVSLDRGIGALFHLANCYEQTARPASAWSLFLEAAALARNINQPEREAAARERASALQPHVPKLIIVVPSEAQLEGLEVRRDGVVVGKGAWGAPIPADPGAHMIEVTAPGKKKFSSQINVPAGGQSTTFEVQALEDDLSAAALPTPGQPPAPQPSSAPEPSAAHGSSAPSSAQQTPGDKGEQGGSQRWLGLAVGGVGLVGLGVSGVLALTAKSRYADAEPYCTGKFCEPAGQDIHDEARSRGNVATVVGIVGLAAVAGGAALYLAAPSASRGSAAGSKRWLAAGPGVMSFGGSW